MGARVKRFKFSFSVFAFFAVIYSVNAFAASEADMQLKPFQIELTPSNSSYSSSADIDAGDNYGILINQLNSSFDTTINNAGQILSSENGYGIYVKVRPVQEKCRYPADGSCHGREIEYAYNCRRRRNKGTG